MKILAIDTCTEVCSVSLAIDGIKDNRLVQNGAKSSNLILPLCAEVLRTADVAISALDLILYTKGPGAFTGVRMCVGVVQGMSLAHAIPSIGFSTLEAMGFGAAEQFNTDKIAVALDARMNEVYWGVYENGELKNQALKKPEAVDVLSAEFIGIGSGWMAYKEALSAQSRVIDTQADFTPKAHYLIDLYLHNPTRVADKKLPTPLYLRNDVAQKNA